VIRKVVRQEEDSGSRHKERGSEDTRRSHVEIVYEGGPRVSGGQ
jgi:hypothetical protein